jgi:hypothetical protein
VKGSGIPNRMSRRRLLGSLDETQWGRTIRGKILLWLGVRGLIRSFAIRSESP